MNTNASEMRVAVVCAFHGGNAGMYSVDLAAQQFLRSLNLSHDFIVMQCKNGQPQHSYGGLNFKVFRDPLQLRDYTHILYWGDFINNPTYGKSGFSSQDVSQGNSKSKEEAYEAWLSLMLPDRRILESQRVISVSNNFQNIDKTILKEDAPILKERFLNTFDAIFPRDPLSFQSLSAFAPEAASGNVFQGIDAAYLFDANSFIGKTLPDEDKPFFSYFFGRSKFSNSDKLIRSVESATGLEARPISKWLACRPSPRESMTSMLAQIKGSRFVISDTYHCCVNTMNMSVPIIGIGRDASFQKGTLGDHKKFILFDMFGLSEYYLKTNADLIDQEMMENIILRSIGFTRNGSDPALFDRITAKKSLYSEMLKDSILDGF